MKPWLAPLLPLVALSGACGLIYQLIWERMLRNSVGADSTASAVTTGVFLFGLGVGAWLFGRRWSHPRRVYALVEIAIGLLALASYVILPALGESLTAAFGLTLETVGRARELAVSAALLLLLPPAVLIGGTWPLLLATFAPGRVSDRRVGLFYGVNTLGAAVGIVAAPLLLLNHVALGPALGITAGANFFVGVGVWRLGRRVSDQVPVQSDPPPAANLGFPALMAGGSGLFGAMFEVVLLRSMNVLDASFAYVFPAVLMVHLASYGAGCVILTRHSNSEPCAVWRRVGLLLIAAACAFVVGIALRSLVTWPEHETHFAVSLLCLGVGAPFFLGGIYPALVRVTVSETTGLPEVAGKLYLASAMGSLWGAMGTQLGLMQILGTVATTRGVIWAGLGLGALAWTVGSRAAPRWWRGLTGVAAIGVGVLWVPDAIFEPLVFVGPRAALVEGSTGVAVLGTDRSIRVNGVHMSTVPHEGRHRLQTGFILAQPAHGQVLLLGLGGGGIARDLAARPEVDAVVVVDWSRELVRLLRSPEVVAIQGDVLAHPKIRILEADARLVLPLMPPASFDVVFDNLTIGDWAGATSVKSVEYYQRVARVLRSRGVFIDGGNFAGNGQREANLAALATSFERLAVHAPTSVTLAGNGSLALDAAWVEAALGTACTSWGVFPAPCGAWIVDGLRDLGTEDLNGITPVRDAWLGFEYSAHPLCGWLHGPLRSTPSIDGR
ncbi:MAG: hypothetical protein A2341_18155 [Deltaproteobacteria bacterium RIFOXYB12_FULL_58_9]|nr:MAG: hypothetical protein A2341_18155 [Deltaproteobacteria bacterium RIFOXYB12_FULL_58_9]